MEISSGSEFKATEIRVVLGAAFVLEGISKNWGHLTTISAIAAAAFGAGIWMKSSMDALESLPEEVKALDQRLESLEDIPKDMKQSNCAIKARIEIAKNEVLRIHVRHQKDEISDRVIKLESLDREHNPQESREYRRLLEVERGLVEEMEGYEKKIEDHSVLRDKCE